MDEEHKPLSEPENPGATPSIVSPPTETPETESLSAELPSTESPAFESQPSEREPSAPALKLPGEEIGSKPNSAPEDGLSTNSAIPSESQSGSAGKLPASSAATSTASDQTPEKKIKSFLRECCEMVLMTLALLIVIRTVLAESRYIPSSSMEPGLQINDRLLVEKVSGWTMRPIERGDILVFYPPPIELGGKDVSYAPLYVLGRLTGLPFLPIDTAYIKRVIALPGEQVEVVKGEGVKINGQLLPEPYIQKPASYDMKILGDIGGRNATGEYIKPYGDSSEPVLVPPGKLFMMGDNRNNSADSHVWGFVEQKRVIGKGCLVFWRLFTPPPYKVSH